MPEMPASSKDVFEVARSRPNYSQTYDRFMEQGTPLSGVAASELKQEEELLMEALRKMAATPDQYTKADRREVTEMLAEIDAAKELYNQESTMGRKPSKEPKGDFSEVERRNMSLWERALGGQIYGRENRQQPSEAAKKPAGPDEEKEFDLQTEMRDARRAELLDSLGRLTGDQTSRPSSPETLQSTVDQYRALQGAERRQERSFDRKQALPAMADIGEEAERRRKQRDELINRSRQD